MLQFCDEDRHGNIGHLQQTLDQVCWEDGQDGEWHYLKAIDNINNRDREEGNGIVHILKFATDPSRQLAVCMA